jgi:hypothetical protein
MPRDVPDPIEPVSGPRKRTLTEKAKEAAVAHSTKRGRVSDPAPAPSRVHSKGKARALSKTGSDDYLLLSG